MPTQKEIVDRLVNVFEQIQELDEDIKTIKEEAKESNMEVAVLVAVAKAVVAGKTGSLAEKSKKIIEVINEV